MNTQTHMNNWSVAKKIAGWLAVLAFSLCAVVVVFILLGKERRVGELLPPLLLAVSSLILRSHAEKRIREIDPAHLA